MLNKKCLGLILEEDQENEATYPTKPGENYSALTDKINIAFIGKRFINFCLIKTKIFRLIKGIKIFSIILNKLKMIYRRLMIILI